MLHDQIKKLRKRAWHYARKRGLDQDADDFAQEYCLESLRLAPIHVSLKFCFMNFMSKHLGNSATVAGRKKIFERQGSFLAKNNSSLLEGKQAPYQPSELKAQFERFKNIEKGIIALKFRWGLTDKEISDAFDMSQTMVNGILRNSKKKLKLWSIEE